MTMTASPTVTMTVKKITRTMIIIVITVRNGMNSSESKNVVLLPHISSATKESRIDMGERVIKNISTFLCGKTPPDIIKKNIYD